MGPRPTVHPSRRRIRRQDMIAESRAPAPTATRENNLGPLTTTFIPPPHCSKAALACATCSSARRGQVCRTQLNGQKSEDDVECRPTATAYPSRGPAEPLGALGFYSPGIICPTGYATACRVSSVLGPAQTTAPAGGLQFPILAGETAIGCCPSGYGCDWVAGQQTCVATATSTKLDAMTCEGSTLKALDAFAIPFTAESKTITAIKLYAPMVQLVHQTTDLPEFQSSSTSIPASSTTNPAKATIPSATSKTDPAAATYFPTDNKLSKTEIGGIIISCLILAFCLFSILFYFWIRKRRPGSPSPSQEKALRDSSSTATSSPTFGSPTPKISSMNAFSTPLQNPTTNDPNYKHYSTSQLGFPNTPGPGPYQLGFPNTPGPTFPNTPTTSQFPMPPMASTDEHGQIQMDTAAAHFGRTLGVEDDLESPIDGTSPFRLKRGNTAKTLSRGNTLKRDHSFSRPRIRERSVSPLAKSEGGIEEWDEIISPSEGRGLDRNVSAVTEYVPVKRKAVGSVKRKEVPAGVEVGSDVKEGRVMPRTPEPINTSGELGRWESQKATVGVATPATPWPPAGVAL